MVDFDSVLANARKLSSDDQAKLIEELWRLMPTNADIPLHPDWQKELERRVAELTADTTKNISWADIRAEALSRVSQGNEN